MCVCQGVTVGHVSTSALQCEPDFRAALKEHQRCCPASAAGRPSLAPGPERASRKQPGKTGLACIFTSRPASCPHSAGEDTALGWPGQVEALTRERLRFLHSTPRACSPRAHVAMARSAPGGAQGCFSKERTGLDSVPVLALLSLNGAGTLAP